MSEQPRGSKAYLQLVLMFVIIIATMLLGYFMLPDSQEEHDRLLEQLGTTNHGTLLMPVRPVSELALRDEAGSPWLWSEHKPKWRMLIPAGRTCEQDCADLLFTTRQVHIRLGKYTHRLERVLVATEGDLSPELRAELEAKHPYLKILTVDGAELSRWLAETNSPWVQGDGRVYLVDPAGAAMMTYDAGHQGNGMLEDLNHLLKYSPD